MWYRFEEGQVLGVPRIENYQVAWYDMERQGSCFDESFYEPNQINTVITYVETIEDINHCDRTRVFANFDNGDVYELKLHKLSLDEIAAASKFE